jgi:transketolase
MNERTCDPAQLAAAIRRIIIDESKRANVGHIGSALSIADIVAALYGSTLALAGDRKQQDRFVLSKGHAALALYAALELTGRLPRGSVGAYCANETLLGVHPEHDLDGIDFCTGSLGHGLSLGTGAALAAHLDGSPRRTFVLLSDAEMNEGSVWEAAMFAAHHQLAGLIAIVDVNGQQALGYTKDVLDLSPLEERWRAFGWDARTVGGHEPAAIADTIASLDTRRGRPHVLLAETTFGYGIGFMENLIEWHYLPLNEEQYELALKDLEAARR